MLADSALPSAPAFNLGWHVEVFADRESQLNCSLNKRRSDERIIMRTIKHLTKKTDMLVPLLGIALVDPGGMNITIRCYQPQPPFLDGSYKVPRLKKV